MSKIDLRKVARNSEQEYAHQYEKQEDYQYPNEDQRVKYHAQDPDDVKTQEDLYGVETSQPEQSVQEEQTTNKIKFDVSSITEDHRQRSYRIKNKPQVYDKSDPGQEAYLIDHDPRDAEVQKIQETSNDFSSQISQEQTVDLTSPGGRVEVSENEPTTEQQFETGDQVEDVEVGLKGKVAFSGRNIVSIVWNDNTRERMSFSDASRFLRKSYVDAAQEQVSPLETPQNPKSNLEINVDKALSSIEVTSGEDDSQKIDIEKIKLQRKVNELQATVHDISIQKIKEKAAKELVDLMQKKGMLSASEEDVNMQMSLIMAMGDEAFESYKNAIVGTKQNDISDIEAILNADDDFSDIEDGHEYNRMKEVIKKASPSSTRSADGIEMGDTSFFENGGSASSFRPKIGDFSSQNTGTQSGSETRKLAASSKERKPIAKHSDSLDLSGFQNIQGPKSPINISNKDMNASSKFADLFGDMGWSGTPKGGSNLRIGR